MTKGISYNSVIHYQSFKPSITQVQKVQPSEPSFYTAMDASLVLYPLGHQSHEFSEITILLLLKNRNLFSVPYRGNFSILVVVLDVQEQCLLTV